MKLEVGALAVVAGLCAWVAAVPPAAGMDGRALLAVVVAAAVVCRRYVLEGRRAAR